MTEISEDMLVNLPIQDGADDVEAHGMREAAVVLGVTAAVLGSGGTAHASQEAGTLEKGTTTVTSTMHGTLVGTELKTGERLSNQLSDESATINSTARDGDNRLGSLESDVNKEVGAVFAKLIDIKNEVEDLEEVIRQDVNTLKGKAIDLIDEKIKDVRDILGDLIRDVKHKSDPVVDEANTQLRSTTETVNERTVFAVGLVNAAPGTINNALDDKMATVKTTANDLETRKDAAATDAATLVSGAGSTVQGHADTAVTTVTGAPKVLTDAAIGAVQTGQQTWDKNAGGLTGPGVEQTISDRAADIEKAASDPNLAAPADVVDNVPDVPAPGMQTPVLEAPPVKQMATEAGVKLDETVEDLPDAGETADQLPSTSL